MQQAVSYFHSGDLSKSEDLLKKILLLNPKNPDGLLILGVIFGVTERQQEAIEVLKKACKINPQNNFIHFNLAKALDEVGKVKESIQHHQRATNLAPRHKEAWLNYGKSLNKLDKDQEAIQCYKKAIEIDSKYAEAFANMGCSLSALHKYEDAIFTIQSAIDINPNLVDAWGSKGQAFYALERYEEAIKCYEIAIELNPKYAVAWFDKGIAFSKLKDYTNALSCYDTALSIEPNLYKAWICKGEIFNRLKNYEAALCAYDAAIEIDPQAFEARCDRGITYNNLKQFDNALYEFEQALKLKADSAIIWMHKGGSLSGLKNWEQAVRCCERAIEIDPNYYEAWCNLGLILMNCGHEERAYESYQKALSINPVGCEVNNNLGGYYLGKFKFKKGWQGIEYRFECLGVDHKGLVTTKKRWDGAPRDNRLFIWSEQGVGDQILYASMFREIEGYPQRVTVSTDKRLISIFERSFPKIKFIDKDIVYAEDNYDEHMPIGSLGSFFRDTLQDFIENSKPYLSVDLITPSQLRFIDSLGPGLICGISWRSSKNTYADQKSIPMEKFMNLLQLNGLHTVNLQYGDIANDLNVMQSNLKCSPIVVEGLDAYNDFDGLLSLINACDVVVTISNVTAHLAGALGKETLLLLPHTVGKFWYWSNHNGHSLCYPSVKIFQQVKQDCWDYPIQEVKKYLQNQIESKNRDKLI